MYRILVYYIVCVFMISRCVAQQGTRPRNAVSFEIGKTGLIVNVAYERLMIADKFGLRVDAGKSFGRYHSLAQAGVGAFVLLGNGSFTGEAGVDVHYLSVDKSSDDQNPGLGLIYPDFSTKQNCPSVFIGGRRYKKNSLFRIGVAGVLISERVIPGGYVSLGRTF